MAGPTTEARNRAVDAVAGTVTHISLHTADGGSDGGNEVTGGSYARKTAAYPSASSASSDISSVVFDVPASTTVSHYGLWDDSTWLGGAALSESKAFSQAGTLTLTSAEITSA